MRRASSRLFVALRFPDAVCERLDALGDAGIGLPGADWARSDQLHLTLRFIGNPDPLSLEDIDRALREVRADSFLLDLKGTGHFPFRADPETLWVGAASRNPGEEEDGTEESENLSRLRNRIESALVRAGLAPEGRKFHPHVTLANVKSCQAPHVAHFEIEHSLFRLSGIPVQEFHLCSSELRLGGAVHTVEATYGLEGMLEGED
jgi:2'-5' RNA ligase